MAFASTSWPFMRTLARANPRNCSPNTESMPRPSPRKSERWSKSGELRGFEFLHQHFGVAAALVVFVAARRREVVAGAFNEAALGLEIGESLGGKSQQIVETKFPRFVLHKMDHLASDPLVLVRRIDVETCQLALAMLLINVQSDASHRVLVDFKDVIIAELLLDAGPAALD